MKVLIAEDDVTSRAILCAVLRKIGHQVVETVDGAAALAAMLAPNAPRLAILDWVMPEMKGVDICRRLRQEVTTDPPYLILLTSKDDEGSVVAGLNSGANDYLKKPYSNNELCARIGVGERVLALQLELNSAKDALAHQATHDALTGILNRRAILEVLAAEIARVGRAGGHSALALCDIDHFKQINDKFGHHAGDQALCGFARVIAENLRQGDFFGRYGGEEFLVVASGASGAVDEPMFDRLRAAVESASIISGEGSGPVTMSVGVAPITGGSTLDEVVAAADAALYKAKADGRNRVVIAP